MTEEILQLKADVAAAKARVRLAKLQDDYHMDQQRQAAVLYAVCLEELEKLEAELAHKIREVELGEPQGAWAWIARMK